jgi:hypothetical protein
MCAIQKFLFHLFQDLMLCLDILTTLCSPTLYHTHPSPHHPHRHFLLYYFNVLKDICCTMPHVLSLPTGRNDYMMANMSGRPAKSFAYLASPLLCAAGSDLRALHFRYYIQGSGKCQLSVYLVVGTEATLLWDTTRGTGFSFSDPQGPVYFRCASTAFKVIIFVVRC